jgi:hypothetical protein
MLKRAGRRLLVSPWFAAGAGVVIATGAIIYVPHANLDFGNAIHVIHCKQAQCRQSVLEQAPGMAAGIGGEQITVSPSAPSVLAGMTFSYQVVERSQLGFGMLITIRARHSISEWKLSFVIPGARDVYVVPGEARWQSSGTDGGTASNFFVGTESAGYAAISGRQDGGFAASSGNGDTVQFQVRGIGTPSAPISCYYNGTPCQFQPSSVQAPASLPGP